MIVSLIVITLLLTGFFSGIEIAFISVNKLNIELKKKQGRRSGYLLSQFLEKPSRFIGTCLVGFNIFLVTYGLLVGHLLDPLWQKWNLANFDRSGSLKLIFEILISTLIVLLFEVFFKAIFRAKSESVLHFFARIMQFFDTIFGGIARFFVAIAEWVLKYIFNVNISEQKQALSRGDLEHYFHQSIDSDEEAGELNTEMFENALSLPSVKVRSCLVPRKEIIAMDIQSSVEAVTHKMIDARLSRLVIYDGSIDNIVGYVHQLDLFKQPADVKSILLPIPAVPETMPATGLITKFSRERKSIAWVVDEFGGTSGIITMEDLLEEIFGEIRDEYDTEELVDKQLAEQEYMFSGRIELDSINEKYGLAFPSADSETLSGYIINEHGGLPEVNEKIIIDSYQFDVISRSDTRIELVKLRVL